MKKPETSPTEQPARKPYQHNGITLIPGDPSIDISDVAGIWADRHDLTLDTLRERAWDYRRRR